MLRWKGIRIVRADSASLRPLELNDLLRQPSESRQLLAAFEALLHPRLAAYSWFDPVGCHIVANLRNPISCHFDEREILDLASRGPRT